MKHSLVRSIATMLLLSGSMASATSHDGLKITGFADLVYRNIDTENVNDNHQNGFLVNDGALYGDYEMDGMSFHLDLPFRRLVAATGESTGNDFEFAGQNPQAYVKWELNDGLHLHLGQFDSVFRVEANDSKHRFFSEGGRIFSSFTPFTHTGLRFWYEMDGIMANVTVANPRDQGTQGNGQTTSTEDDDLEYILQVGYSNEMFRGKVGYLMRSEIDDQTNEGETYSLLEVIVGADFAGVSVDLQYDMKTDPSEADGFQDDDSTAWLALVQYQIMDGLKVALRYEMLSDFPDSNNTTVSDVTTVALGLNYQYHEHLTARVAYGMNTLTNQAAVGGAEVDIEQSVFSVGAVASF